MPNLRITDDVALLVDRFSRRGASFRNDGKQFRVTVQRKDDRLGAGEANDLARVVNRRRRAVAIFKTL
jgi:hypothetical protein